MYNNHQILALTYVSNIMKTVGHTICIEPSSERLKKYEYCNFFGILQKKNKISNPILNMKRYIYDQEDKTINQNLMAHRISISITVEGFASKPILESSKY